MEKGFFFDRVAVPGNKLAIDMADQLAVPVFSNAADALLAWLHPAKVIAQPALNTASIRLGEHGLMAGWAIHTIARSHLRQ